MNEEDIISLFYAKSHLETYEVLFPLAQRGNKIANYRGIGLSDMINSIANNRDFRCSLELSLHILEIMESIIISANDNKQVNINTKPKQPNPLNDDEILSLKQK